MQTEKSKNKHIAVGETKDGERVMIRTLPCFCLDCPFTDHQERGVGGSWQWGSNGFVSRSVCVFLTDLEVRVREVKCFNIHYA